MGFMTAKTKLKKMIRQAVFKARRGRQIEVWSDGFIGKVDSYFPKAA
jgi:hypothetical protein